MKIAVMFYDRYHNYSCSRDMETTVAALTENSVSGEEEGTKEKRSKW